MRLRVSLYLPVRPVPHRAEETALLVDAVLVSLEYRPPLERVVYLVPYPGKLGAARFADSSERFRLPESGLDRLFVYVDMDSVLPFEPLQVSGLVRKDYRVECEVEERMPGKVEEPRGYVEHHGGVLSAG